MNQDKNVDI